MASTARARGEHSASQNSKTPSSQQSNVDTDKAETPTWPPWETRLNGQESDMCCCQADGQVTECVCYSISRPVSSSQGATHDDRFPPTLKTPRLAIQIQVVVARLLLNGRLDLPVMHGWRVAHLPVELQRHPRALVVGAHPLEESAV